jgi:GNAT superfamily N-acetyltransferase
MAHWLDNVTFHHGPRKLLSAFCLRAEQRAGKLGIRLALETDFDRLAAFNRTQSDNWGPLFPAFYGAEDAFWICGTDLKGDIVTTAATRLYRLGEAPISSKFDDLSVMYADGGITRPANESFEGLCLAADYMTGNVAMHGAMWSHPAYRRRGLSDYMVRLTYALALGCWNVDYAFGLAKKALPEAVLRHYGMRNRRDGIRWHEPYFHTWSDMQFVWNDRVSMIDDIDSWVSETEDDPTEPFVSGEATAA